jgi:nicotinamidase-related amidase
MPVKMLQKISTIKPAFLCCDLQEKFAAAVPAFDRCVFVANRFVDYAAIVGADADVKYVATEQYPKGLGNTVKEIRLGDFPGHLLVDKTSFSMLTPEVSAHIGDRTDVVLFGIEAHVCVLQTVEGLVAMGKRVHVCVDGTHSQREEDRGVALATMARMSDLVVLTTSEAALLHMTRDASDPNFKKVSALLRAKPPGM